MTGSDSFGNDLVWLSVLVQRRYAQICADHDLTSVQATLLCVIRDRPQGMGELAQELGVAKNALSGLVDRMERRGLVRREAGRHDRRAITLNTTARGKEIVGALYADVSERMPAVAGALPADEQNRLAASVARIAASARLAGSAVQASGRDGVENVEPAPS